MKVLVNMLGRSIEWLDRIFGSMNLPDSNLTSLEFKLLGETLELIFFSGCTVALLTLIVLSYHDFQW
jgi:hypothetical protein